VDEAKRDPMVVSTRSGASAPGAKVSRLQYALRLAFLEATPEVSEGRRAGSVGRVHDAMTEAVRREEARASWRRFRRHGITYLIGETGGKGLSYLIFVLLAPLT